MKVFDFCILGCGKQGRVIGNRLIDEGYKVCGIDVNEDLKSFQGNCGK